MRRLLLTLAIAPMAVGFAQNPGQHLSVDVTIKSIVVRGDTIGVRATVHNSSSSSESLLTYVVDVPGGVTHIVTPTPADLWDAITSSGDRPVASWTTGELVAPGASTPELYFEAVGLPGIEPYWAGGDYQYPSYDSGESPDTATVSDPLHTAMITGTTLGVEPWSAVRTPQALLARLRSLTVSACAAPLAWLPNTQLCDQLLSDLDQAETFRAAGQNADARNSLNHYANLLSGSEPGTPASGATTSAYWLLTTNAQIVLGLLP